MSRYEMPKRDEVSFQDGMSFFGSNCDNENIGHDTANALVAYDFNGTVLRICPRPWCMEIIDTIAVDDLSREEFNELKSVIREVSKYREE